MTGYRPRVELYVRSLSPEGAGATQEAVVQTLTDLDEADVIDGYEVFVWGDRVPVDCATARIPAARWVLERVERFRSWAAEEGVCVDGIFERCEAGTLVEERREVLSLPSVLLAEYDGDGLVQVAPQVAEGGTYTVSDHLASLAGDTRSAVGATMGARS